MGGPKSRAQEIAEKYRNDRDRIKSRLQEGDEDWGPPAQIPQAEAKQIDKQADVQQTPKKVKYEANDG